MKSKVWQFSIREILLIMIAVAAIAAMIQSKRGYTPSEFLLGLDSKAVIEEACQRQDIDVFFQSSSNGYVNRLKYSVWREARFVLIIPDASRFIEYALDDVAEILKKQVPDRYGGGGTQNDPIHERRISYTTGHTDGRVNLRAFKINDETVVIVVRVLESHDP